MPARKPQRIAAIGMNEKSIFCGQNFGKIDVFVRARNGGAGADHQPRQCCTKIMKHRIERDKTDMLARGFDEVISPG